MKKIKLGLIVLAESLTGHTVTMYETREEFDEIFGKGVVEEGLVRQENFVGVIKTPDSDDGWCQIYKHESFEIIEEVPPFSYDIEDYKQMVESGIDIMQLEIRNSVDLRDSLQKSADAAYFLYGMFMRKVGEYTKHIADMEEGVDESLKVLEEIKLITNN